MPTEIRHFNIPVFIPEMACPNRCIYCNQYKITGVKSLPDENEIEKIIETNLKTIDIFNTHVEVAFFGGNFTGVPLAAQEKLLSIVQKYISDGPVRSIRISTRPDYINEEILSNLKRYNVKTIELGVQSMNDEVLGASGRVYSSRSVVEAARIIKGFGFDLCMQMMIGLPEDTLEKSLKTAQSIIDCGASMTRIYPLLVIKDTPLENKYKRGEYEPLSLSEAVSWTHNLYKIFFESNVTVLKMGLHPSEELMNGGSIIAGPFHSSFAELVFTSLWNEKFNLIKPDKLKCLEVYVNAKDYNHAIGYKASNKKMLATLFKKVNFDIDNTLKRFSYNAIYS